ncbi:hypothetical protein HY497_01865 [Candidatus Woesearchaeota archaeon]|nr:hypothetical protein [Candidatus Woesearchaeota archaeon]
MKKRDVVLLGLLFLTVLSLRIYFAFKTPYFSYDAYFDLRIIEHIAETGRLSVQDPLAYGGRTVIVLPLFYYLLGLLAWIFPLQLVAKAAPQFFMSFLPIVVFLIVEKITQKSPVAFFSAVLSAFVPVVLVDTLYSISPITLVVPLLFLALFVFLHIDKKTSAFYFVFIVAALSLVHPSSAILIIALIGYLFISMLERLELEKPELELIFFSTFLFLWLLFIFYKRAFIFHGFALLQQNIPSEIISRYFTHLSFAGALVQIGLLPLIGGVFALSKYLFIKNKQLYMYIALAISVTVLLWLRLIQPSLGLIFLSISLCILSGPTYVYLVRYFNKTKLSYLYPLFIITAWLLVIPLLVVPTLYLAGQERGIPDPVYEAMIWLKENTPEDSVVLAAPPEGHALAGIAERKTVIDDYFLLIKDADGRLSDVNRAFTTPFATEAAKLFVKYDIDYILFSRDAEAAYSITSLAYKDEECINKVYDRNGVAIFRTRCRVEVA